MTTLKTSQFWPAQSQFPPPHQKQVNFDPNSKTKSNLIPLTKIKLIWTLLKSSQFDPYTEINKKSMPRHRNEVNFDFSTPIQIPSKFRSLHWNQIDFDHPHNNQIYLSLHWNKVKVHPPHWNQVNFDYLQKNKLICMLTIKSSYVWPEFKNQANRDHPHKKQVDRSTH